MTTLLQATLSIAGAVFVLAMLLTALPHLWRMGRATSEAFCRPPLLDIVLAILTCGPWIVGAVYGGWVGLAGAIAGQMVALYAWIFVHEMIHLRAIRGPRIVRFCNRLVGRPANHLALWLTLFGVPLLWLVRVLEIFIYPTLVWLLRFPRYRHGDWVTLSRHKFRDLVGHDLVWCLYCDWMTGTWSLGTEMLRNVESFWCPIRFEHPQKLANCTSVFPDIEGGWVAADGSMAQVQAVLEEKYGGEGDRSWFGHPGRPEQRLSVAGRAAGPQPPPSPTPDELALADARAAVCAQCEHLKRRGDGTPAITRTKTLSDGSIHQLHHVGCKPCGCGPVSLIRGSCFYRRWLIEPSPATAEG